MVADAVIYHPSVSHYLKFVATTVGRDKLLRTLQYFSRFMAWYLYRTNHSQASIAPYDAVKKQFGLTRKLLRLGKWVEHLKAAAIASDAKTMDPVLRYCAVGRQLGYAGYLSLDNIGTIDTVGIKKFPASQRILREAYRSWFAGLSFSVISSLYSLYKLRQRSSQINEKEGESVVEGKKIQRETNALRMQLVSDLADLTVPTAALGWLDLDDGFVGLAGTLSSLLGIYSQWKKTA